MGRIPAHGADTLLERKERFIDISSLLACDAIGGHGIGAALITSQIDQRELILVL